MKPGQMSGCRSVGNVKLTRVDHLGAMLQCDLDNLVAREISANRGVLPALANDVGLIGLCSTEPHVRILSTMTSVRSGGRRVGPGGPMLRTLPVHAETVLITARVSTLGPNWRYQCRNSLLRPGSWEWVQLT